MNGRRETGTGSGTAFLVLIDQSGAKREVPLPSAGKGMIAAEQALRRRGRHLREVKLVSQNKAVARWKADELHWRRVA